MARKKFTELTEEPQLLDVQNQDDLYANYVMKKQELDALDKLVKKLAEAVKQQMESEGIKSAERNGYKITRIASQRITWNEEALLEKVKTFNKPELVCVIEKVDVAKLEQAICNDEICINDLQNCQTVKEVVSVRMDKIKEKQPDGL